jgi:cysteine desulfurase/selenocysteine lyase
MTASASHPINLSAVRADTPGVEHRAHFNNAGAALMANPVLNGVIGHLKREAEIGGYEAAAEKSAQLDDVYERVATLVGGRKEEIAITENATVAWQRAFYAMDFKPSDRILTASAEFAANYLAFLQVAKRTGASIQIIPNDSTGALDPDALKRMIDKRVRLIAITWLPTNGGLVNPAAEVGKIAQEHGITYLLDACQAVGQMPIDVQALGCDMLTATGRKFLRAPRGTGFLYIRKEVLDRTEPAMIDLFGASWVAPGDYQLRPDARRFETWETNYSTRIGLGIATEYALNIGLDAIEARCKSLSDTLRTGLKEIPGVLMRDVGRHLSAIISFNIEGMEAAAVMQQLSAIGINVSVSPPSSTPIDATERRLPPVVRISPHYYNSEEELERLVSAIWGMAKHKRA